MFTYLLFTCLIITDRVSRNGKAIGSVRQSVRLFPLCLRLLTDWTLNLSFCMCVWDMIIVRQSLKVKVTGRGQSQG